MGKQAANDINIRFVAYIYTVGLNTLGFTKESQEKCHICQICRIGASLLNVSKMSPEIDWLNVDLRILTSLSKASDTHTVSNNTHCITRAESQRIVTSLPSLDFNITCHKLHNHKYKNEDS